MFAKTPRKLQDFNISCDIFLGIPGILVDFDDSFCWMSQKKSREFVGNLWIFEKIPRIFLDFDAILLVFFVVEREENGQQTMTTGISGFCFFLSKNGLFVTHMCSSKKKFAETPIL